MDSYLLGMGTAIWLGILTSISPCPLATNIAAISFIGREPQQSYRVRVKQTQGSHSRTLGVRASSEQEARRQPFG